MFIGKNAGEIEKRYTFSEYVIGRKRFRLKKVLKILALVIMF